MAVLRYRFAGTSLNSTTYKRAMPYGALLTTDALFAKCFPTPKIPAAVCKNSFIVLFDVLSRLASAVTAQRVNCVTA
jgi:hypothetical protein